MESHSGRDFRLAIEFTVGEVLKELDGFKVCEDQEVSKMLCLQMNW